MIFLRSVAAIFLIAPLFLCGQNFQILHYTETSGFDHGTRQNSLAMFQNLGQQHGFTVDDDQTGAAFNTLANLQQYAAVVFSNTSGDQILDSAQRANFEAYINGGGAFIGIHAASDTYRHSTANGSNTGSWDWYAETLGGSVQQNPNHTASNHSGTMDVLVMHPTTANIPDPWNKVEEYYYWENGFLASDNVDLLEVRSTGSNSYDATRPMSWYKELPSGARIFYTALGHANSNFTSDTAFQNHLRDALLWASRENISLHDATRLNPCQIFPNPAKGEIQVISSESSQPLPYCILGLNGRRLSKGVLEFSQQRALLATGFLPPGQYLLQIGSEEADSQQNLPFVIR